jgi:hypothetical protein
METNATRNGVVVDVEPDLGSGEWSLNIERLTESGGWTRVVTQRTRGGQETVRVNLDAGAYRAVVPPQRDYRGSMSSVVVLEK